MAIKGKALINGTAYTHSDILLTVLGIPIIEFSSLEYSKNQDMQNNYGAQSLPTSVGIGQVNYTGSITMSRKEYDRLSRVSPSGDLQNLPIDKMRVIMATDAGDVTTDRITFRFKGISNSSSVGNMNTEVTVELHVVNIEYNLGFLN